MSKINAYKKIQPFDEDLKEKTIMEYAPIIKNIALKLAKRFSPHISVDDMINAGVIGLIDAIEKFNDSKGVKFRTYAEYRIRGAMLDELRGFDWVPRSTRDKIKEMEKAFTKLEQKFSRTPTDEELADEMKISIEEVHSILANAARSTLLSLNEIEENSNLKEKRYLPRILLESDEDIISKLNLENLKTILAELIDNLPEKERLVISLYYYEDVTMREIGEILGITESRVSQIHSKALFTLKTKIKNSFNNRKNRS
ncbi:MAG: FliA/WhiG family RNA polymerase sigma factor [Candidatus Schekmanbacteria bacterium]|nr:MAG: FliA/WhiG family RNA polymerase sigma factor [Candidatus Schekmanbacteria bacterium]